MHALELLLAALATWRVSWLLHAEDGPFHLAARLRAELGRLRLGGALECLYCTSVWVAAPVAVLVAPDLRSWALAWLGLSGAAILVDRAIHGPLPVWREEPPEE